MNKQKVRSKGRGKTKKRKKENQRFYSLRCGENKKKYHQTTTIVRKLKPLKKKKKVYTVVELEKSILYLPSYNCREGIGTVARWSETYFPGWFVFSSDELCVFLYHSIKPSERILRFNRLVFLLY